MEEVVAAEEVVKVAAVGAAEEEGAVAAESVERRAVACGQFRGIRGLLVKAARSPYGWSPGQTPDSTT